MASGGKWPAVSSLVIVLKENFFKIKGERVPLLLLHQLVPTREKGESTQWVSFNESAPK